jgi:hypothetical protein
VSVRDDIVTFLHDPTAFAATTIDPEVWLRGLEAFAFPSIAAKGDWALRPAQEAAWRGLANRRVGLVLGPPGTGKTHLLSWLIAGHLWARRESGLQRRIFVTAFTRNAVGNLLDAVADRLLKHMPEAAAPLYLGVAPPVGLSDRVEALGRDGEERAASAIADGQVVLGGTIWSLYRLLTSGAIAGAEGPTAPLFDLVCIDEASQMVLGHGLMALGGLAPAGRVVVSGDDRQLPPVRALHETTLGGRELGGSLYSFLKSTDAAEFPLDETFRLNAPLTVFPEERFYPSRYTSAVPDQRLALAEGWQVGLSVWQRAALDPEYPIVIFVHDSPPAATSNPFEAALVADLAVRLRERVIIDGEPCSPQRFWAEIARVISPHRAQNARIRAALRPTEEDVAFVETVDRIQGKERDAILLSYCVADPEFALAEGEFIFSLERLNVAITRARSKLVVFVSRRLLEAAPSDQAVMDKAELLREFVFACEARGDLVLTGPAGEQIAVQVRARGFEGATAGLDLTEEPQALEVPTPAMTARLEGILQAIRDLSLTNRYGSAPLKALRQALALPREPFAECRDLHYLGRVSLQQRTGPYGAFWIAKPLAEPRRVYDIGFEAVQDRIAQVVREARQGKLAPFYNTVRDRFAWMAGDGSDALLPVAKTLEAEGAVVFGALSNGALTIDVPRRPAEPLPDDDTPPIALDDRDFLILNALEDSEAKGINFGVFDGWTSSVSLARKAGLPADEVAAAVGRLAAAGHLMLTDDGRIRSRMAELAREIRYVKQRFKAGDGDKRPYLVRSLKVRLRDRDKPARNIDLAKALDGAKARNPAQAAALDGLLAGLRELWGSGPKVASFQMRGFEAVLAAWRGEGADTLVVSAETGAGKTEAAVLPLIAASAADRSVGIRGVRAVLTYPRVRLVANQAQRIAHYLAALARVRDLSPVSLGMQVGQVPVSFEQLHDRDVEAGWARVGIDALTFPFFGCPRCAAPLHLMPDGGVEGADALVCTAGDWRFDGWVGSKAGLRRAPPALFLSTIDSLHQWLHDPRYGDLFGDRLEFAPPRALLADEIHLYTNIHGAQVGLTLRRLAARAALNGGDDRQAIAIGMSATLGEPAAAWAKLIGRADVSTIRPDAEELELNPRGREYFYFIQPEVESRGYDIAGASTTIQGLMCLAHGMRRRTGQEGGFRSLVFLNSIDKLRRLHGAYLDAEEGRELASLRINDYGDDASGEHRKSCCREPAGCDRFAEGECWWFAANDERQRTAAGRLPAGAGLKVAERPVFSGTAGNVERLIKSADIVFSTSSLEVGYDDPDIALVYQHYAPQNLASFIQRKGRGGRGADDRPITAATLSIYSPRDTWWFRRPDEMISPVGFETPLNPDNFFVRRGQALCTIFSCGLQIAETSPCAW